MELVDTKKYHISSPVLEELDRQRNDLNRLIATESDINCFDMNDGMFSLSLAHEANVRVSHIKKVAEKLELHSMSQFDQLVAQDIVDNAKKIQTYVSFAYDPKTNFRTGSLLSALYGTGTFQKLKNMAKPRNWPHKKILEQGKTIHPQSSYSYTIEDILENIHDPTFQRLKKNLLKELGDAKNEAEEFYIRNGLITNLEGIKFHYSPTCFGFSYWENSRMNHVHIDPHKVVSYLSKNSAEPVIKSSMIKPIAVHEVGHALNEVLSLNTMPIGFAGGSERYIPFIHGVTGEGCALNAETLWFNQARKSGKLHGLDLKLVDYLMDLYLDRKVFSLVYNLLKLHEDELDSNPRTPTQFNKRAQFQMAELTGIRRHMFTNTFFDTDITTTLYGITYLKGQEQATLLNQRAKKEGYAPQQLMLGLMKGSWSSLPAQEKFLFNIYLPDLKRQGIAEPIL